MQIDPAGLWTRYLDDLLDIAAALRRRLTKLPVLRGQVEEDGSILFVSDGSSERSRVAANQTADLVTVVAKHPRHEIILNIPPSWLVAKDLPPVTRDAVAFLPAFIGHQIERLTPWRAADVVFVTEIAPLEDPKLCAVLLFLAPKHRIVKLLDFLTEQGSRVSISARLQGRTILLPVSTNASRRPLHRRALGGGLVLAAGAMLTLTAALVWANGQLTTELQELDTRIAAEQALLGRLEMKQSMAAHAYSPLRVQTLEDLSRLLPDDVYLTAIHIGNDRTEISGVARRASELVSVLEGSKQFTDVAFTGPTTRSETGAADQFQLAMKVVAAEPGREP